MNSKTTTILKWVVLLFAAVVFVLSVTYLPSVANSMAEQYPQYSQTKIPLMIYLYISSIGFYYAIVMAVKICNNINKNILFDNANLKAFFNTSMVALAELVYYAVGLVAALCFDLCHQYVVIFFAVVVFCALVLYLLCAVVCQMLKKAIAIREENDLTV